MSVTSTCMLKVAAIKLNGRKKVASPVRRARFLLSNAVVQVYRISINIWNGVESSAHTHWLRFSCAGTFIEKDIVTKQLRYFPPRKKPEESTYNGTRKPIEGDCPICVFEMEPGEEIVWCKASCGQNFHKECFDQWRRSKNGDRVTCVYCRTQWQEDVPALGSIASLKEAAPKIGRYRNIGHHAMYRDQVHEE